MMDSLSSYFSSYAEKSPSATEYSRSNLYIILTQGTFDISQSRERCTLRNLNIPFSRLSPIFCVWVATCRAAFCSTPYFTGAPCTQMSSPAKIIMMSSICKHGDDNELCTLKCSCSTSCLKTYSSRKIQRHRRLKPRRSFYSRARTSKKHTRI